MTADDELQHEIVCQFKETDRDMPLHKHALVARRCEDTDVAITRHATRIPVRYCDLTQKHSALREKATECST